LKKPMHPHLWTTVVILFVIFLAALFVLGSLVSKSPELDMVYFVLVFVLFIIVGVLISLDYFYKGLVRTREKFEKELKQYPMASWEYAAKDPLRCKEIIGRYFGASTLGAIIGHETGGRVGDKIACLYFTKDKLLVVRLGRFMDFHVGSRGTNVDDFGDIPLLFVGKGEQAIMKVAKGSYSIPFASILKVELKSWMRWDKVIEITTATEKKRFRTGEDPDRVRKVFSQYISYRFVSK